MCEYEHRECAEKRNEKVDLINMFLNFMLKSLMAGKKIQQTNVDFVRRKRTAIFILLLFFDFQRKPKI